MKTLDKVANQTVTVEDNEARLKSNIDREAKPLPERKPVSEIAFNEEVAYDPRLINAGVVYGD